MKRSIVQKTFSLAVLASAMVLSGCSGDDAGAAATATDNAPAGLLESGKFRLCTYPEYPPLEYFEDGTGGKIVGFDVDLARAVGTAWGVETTVTNTSFDSLIPGLAAGRCDAVLSGLYVNDQRQEVADVVPYLLTGSALAAPPEVLNGITSPASLSGKRVAVQSGSTFVKVLEKVNTELESAGNAPAQIIEYPQTPLAVGAVLGGKADILMETDIAITDIVSKNGGKLKDTDSIFPPDQVFGAYFSKGSPLVKAFTEQIEGMRENGTLGELASKYGLSESKLEAQGKQ
jgi:polar amino acid transport system substrate-binding protein